jgi:hypothetical protein
MYGVESPVPFIAKLERAARERVFVMMREGDMPHPAAVLRQRLHQEAGPPMPQFSDLFMLLMQMGIAPDVDFIRYRVLQRYRDLDEAVADCRPMFGGDWDEARTRSVLDEVLVRDGDDLVFDAGLTLTGVAHWQPRAT